MKLSVVISVYNNKDLIKDCLESVAFADEIVVVDHESTDGTVEIVKKYTKKLFSEPNDPSKIDIQKNVGFTKAKGEWILSLDADERISPELATEITKTINSDSVYVAYRIPRKNIIFGKWIEHSLWWPDLQLRLFKRGKGRYEKQKVHQELAVDGQVGTLTTPFVHENYQSLSQYLQKMDRYTENEASALLASNSHMHWIDAIRLPLRDFLKTFFLQQGYKDGLHGLVLSILQAFYSFLIFAKVWEKQGFREENSKDFLMDIYKEWLILQKEISYWFFTVFLTHTKNPFKQLQYKLNRKRVTPKQS